MGFALFKLKARFGFKLCYFYFLGDFTLDNNRSTQANCTCGSIVQRSWKSNTGNASAHLTANMGMFLESGYTFDLMVHSV